MSGYDGPSIFRQQAEKDKKEKKPAQIQKSSRSTLASRKKDSKIEKPSLKNVALSRTAIEKRSSTPFSPTKLPSREYFDKRYQAGSNEGQKQMYQELAKRLEKDDEDLIYYAYD